MATIAELERKIRHAIFDQREIVAAFYKFPLDYVGPDRDAARDALGKSDEHLRLVITEALIDARYYKDE